jgi:hypothetical protein
MARDFDRALTKTEIPHTYEEFVGDHMDKWPSRLYIALPFLSDLLSSDTLAPVQPKGKLAVTWASIKLWAD